MESKIVYVGISRTLPVRLSDNEAYMKLGVFCQDAEHLAQMEALNGAKAPRLAIGYNENPYLAGKEPLDIKEGSVVKSSLDDTLSHNV